MENPCPEIHPGLWIEWYDPDVRLVGQCRIKNLCAYVGAEKAASVIDDLNAGKNSGRLEAR